MKVAVEIIGWAAAVVILAAYGLLSAGRMKSTSRVYHAMNIVGALGFVVNSGYNGALPSAMLNIVWMGIGAYGLFRGRLART